MLPPQLMIVATLCRIVSPIFLTIGIAMIVGALVCKGLVKWRANLSDKKKTKLQRTYK